MCGWDSLFEKELRGAAGDLCFSGVGPVAERREFRARRAVFGNAIAGNGVDQRVALLGKEEILGVIGVQ